MEADSYKKFEAGPLLTGRTEIENISKLNAGLTWSCPGVAFAGNYFDSTYFSAVSTTTGTATANTAGTDQAMWASVNLPNGATITHVIVYGSTTNENYSLIRTNLSAGTATSTLATAAVNTEDTSISDAVVDNMTYCYFLVVTLLDQNDIIYGARITYTI